MPNNDVRTDGGSYVSDGVTTGGTTWARAAYERALRILERFLPPEHPTIRGALGNLANLDRETAKTP